MSVRIYQLSKQLDLSNKEVIDLLKERGLDVSSPSNTIPNIYADAILEEFKKEEKTQVAIEQPEAQPKRKEHKPATPPPPSKFVKTAQEIEEAKKEALKTKSAETPPASNRPAPIIIKKPSSAPPTLPTKSEPAVTYPPQETAPAPSSSTPTLPKTAPVAPAKIHTTPPREKKPSGELQILHCKPPIVVREFAQLLEIKPFKLISELMELGIFASMNQPVEQEVAAQLAAKHGFLLEVHHRGEQQQTKKEEEKPVVVDEKEFLEPRPPVVCVLGHVDHGKTTLLDTIRKANVVSGEAGGITQHIGAYQVEHNNHKITFIDTPGHAAFSKMRERGANITDIAILVVAADDAFKPQTDEALKFAKKANVPVVVAINKMDAKGANPDRVMQQMQERNIGPEAWGGETLCTQISALKGENIEELLELILLQAEVMELKANPKCPAEGVVIESQMEVGRGSTATIIIEKGTLKIGDSLVCGDQNCKVRAIIDDAGNKLKTVTPGSPALILGWSSAPEAGASFQVVKNEREAKKIAAENHHEEQKRSSAAALASGTPFDLKNLFAAIEQQQQKTLRVILKGDVKGTVEALAACLKDIPSNKVSLEIITEDIGPIGKNDVLTAHAAEAVIVAFNTKCEPGIQAVAKHHNVQLIQHNIIYELIDQVKEVMAELLDPELKENKLGAAEVRQVFSVSKGLVAGCMVTEGKITHNSLARVLRGKNKEVIHEGRISTLKRFKEDSSEVRAGYECGIQVSGFNKFEEGDLIECHEVIKIRPSL